MGNQKGEGGDGPEGSFRLRTVDLRLLDRVARLLIGVLAPARARAALRVGYTQQEHALGWSLYGKATGQGRSLDLYDDDGDGDQTPAAGQMGRLRELDAFENLWFPRTRAVLLRVAPPEERGRLANVFFKGLEQQPLGPLVVGSVAAFLLRLDGLSSSTMKGAAEAREMLRQRGLNDAEVARVRGLLDQVRDVSGASSEHDPRERLEAEREQRAALVSLRAWLRDWGAMLRPAVPKRDWVELGLAPRWRRGGGVERGEGEAGDA